MRAIRCRSFLLLRRDGVEDEYHGRLIHENTLITAKFVHQTEEKNDNTAAISAAVYIDWRRRNDVEIKSDKKMRKYSQWQPIICGERSSIPQPTIRLPPHHPCHGCVWYDRNNDVLFCPFRNCVRHKKSFSVR